jgi:RNA polymerase sigma-70 factor (ECF subfamily)
MSLPPGSGETRKLPSDAELLEQTGRGNQAAFNELVNRHGRYLYGIARGLTGNNAADAEDLVQETLIGALNSRFRGESAVRTWLVSILVRRAAMLRRSRKRQAGWIETSEAEQPSQPSSAAGTEARLDLAVMLEVLSPEHRQIIVLRELEQMSYEEMATTLGVPRGTVESRLHRAREELRKRFKGYQP